MKIIRETKEITECFDNLAIGQVFEYNKNIYIKIELPYEAKYDAFNLTNSKCEDISETAIVIPLD